MLHRCSSASPRDDDPPSPDHFSPEFFDLDLDLPDFDPVMQWLVDPLPDLAPMPAVAEPGAPNPDVPNPETDHSAALIGSSIDEKTQKVSLVESSGHPDGLDAGLEAVGLNGDGLPAVAEPGAPNPDVPNPEKDHSAASSDLIGSSIDEKMQKVNLVESSGHPDDGLDAGLEAVGLNGDGLPAAGVSGDEDGIIMDSTAEAAKGEGVSEVCSTSDSIKVAHETEEEESSESETDDSEDLETSSSSSDDSSSSSSSEEDDDDDIVDDDNKNIGERSKGGKVDEMLDLEEGEIRDPDQEEMLLFSDEEEEVSKGPIKSKHEIKDLPPVPQIEVSLEPHHQTLPVGMILCILGTCVVVEGLEKHNPLYEGSILWITETRSPLGVVDETFGPVKSPYYVVRYNSDKEVPAGISMGTAVSFVMEFANQVLNDKDLYKKGYDASGDNDEEFTDEVEFSDDEKEAEYKRSLRQSKRAADNTMHGKQEIAFDERTNIRGAMSNDMRHGNHESAIDKRRTTVRVAKGTCRRHGNHESAIDKQRTDFRSHPLNDRWHGNQESESDKRTNRKGAPSQKHSQTPVSLALPAMGQQLPCVSGPLQSPSVAADFGLGSFTSVGSGNAFERVPPMSAAIPQAMQMNTCFSDLSQHLLLQQINALLTQGFPPQKLQMVQQGGYPMNVLASPQVGDMPYHPQQQNMVFNGFPNAVPCQQQLIPNVGPRANLPWIGGMPNLSISPPSFGALNVSQTPFGCSNLHGLGASGSCHTQNYGQPPPANGQGGMRPMLFNPFIGPASLGAVGQSNVSQAPFGCGNMSEQGASDSCNAESFQQNPSAINQGGMHHPMQFNSSMVPASLGPVEQSSIGRGPFGSSNVHEQGASGSQNAENYRQHPPAINQSEMHPMPFNPSVGPASVGPWAQSSVGQAPFGCNNMQKQGASGSFNAQSCGQLPAATDQGEVSPMHFNPSIGPSSVRTAGQSSVSQTPFGRSNIPEKGASSSWNAVCAGQNPSASGIRSPFGQASVSQAPFGCSNIQELGASGSFNSQSFGDPSPATDQDMRPMQFNQGRSSFRGRKPYPRGGRRTFGRGGQPQNQ